MRVLTVREILAYNVAENISARVDLEGMAFSAMTYTMEIGTKVGGLGGACLTMLELLQNCVLAIVQEWARLKPSASLNYVGIEKNTGTPQNKQSNDDISYIKHQRLLCVNLRGSL